MPKNHIIQSKNCWIVTSEDNSETIDSLWFDDKYWLNQGRLLGASSGRGSAWMVKSEQQKMMLRHYYRGGIPAKFIKDKYFWTGLNNSRSFSEYYLLNKMVAIGLPAPQAIAAQTCKKGLFYQGNILIAYIKHQSTFAGIMNSNNNEQNWKNIGQTIADFHNHGINHADLNAHNILINNDKTYLIDFDHSKQCKINNSWQQANIKRLKRSIDKLTEEKNTAANNTKWQALLNSYTEHLNT